MATYLRSGRFLRTVYSHEKFIKMLSSLPWNAFHEMPLETRLVKRLNDLGITALTEIQQKSLGPILKGDNVIVNAETGSGKTLCYLVPVVNRLLRLKIKPRAPSALILVPNMDLGYQITEIVNSLCDAGSYACPLHRNSPLRINQKYSFIISTPQTLMQYSTAFFSSIQTIVIDEADLIISNDGKRFWKFIQSYQHLAKNNNGNGQVIFVAATLPQRGGKSVFREILNRFPDINYISSSNAHQYVPSLTNIDIFVNEETKLPQLLRHLNILNGYLPYDANVIECRSNFGDKLRSEEHCRSEGNFDLNEPKQIKRIKVLVFTNTVSMAKKVFNFLNSEEKSTFEEEIKKTTRYTEPDTASVGVVKHTFYKEYIKTRLTSNEECITETGATECWQNRVGILIKEMSRSEREEVLTKFRRNKISVLVSTDLASRGLDICDISHVIQVDYARNAADTLHRAGRTARAGSSGTILNFVTEEDKDLWRAVKLTMRSDTETFQDIFSRKRQFSRRIKKKSK